MNTKGESGSEMSNERFHIAAFAIVYDWKESTDPTRKGVDIHLTNEDLLIEAIAKELEREHNDTKKTFSEKASG